MGILDEYNKSIYNPANASLRRRSRAVSDAPLADPEQLNSFDKTSLDLENSSPLGGPINIPYTTKVGSETISKTTTQPYTPKNTYIDNLQSDELIERARDPFR